jgi:hypothetical protein
MNADDTGNAKRLLLAERARRGLLGAEPELSIEEIAELEHPTDLAARKALGAAIQVAIEYGDLQASYSEQEIPLMWSLPFRGVGH